LVVMAPRRYEMRTIPPMRKAVPLCLHNALMPQVLGAMPIVRAAGLRSASQQPNRQKSQQTECNFLFHDFP
jgi:hypothetical protein